MIKGLDIAFLLFITHRNAIIYITLFAIQWQRRKQQSKTDNKQETETRLNINSHINHIKSFRSHLAQPKTELHTELSTFINFVGGYISRWFFCLPSMVTHPSANRTRHCISFMVIAVPICPLSKEMVSHIWSYILSLFQTKSQQTLSDIWKKLLQQDVN